MKRVRSWHTCCVIPTVETLPALRYSRETSPGLIGTREGAMNNIFYVIGVVVVVLVILGYFGLR